MVLAGHITYPHLAVSIRLDQFHAFCSLQYVASSCIENEHLGIGDCGLRLKRSRVFGRNAEKGPILILKDMATRCTVYQVAYYGCFVLLTAADFVLKD